MRIIESNEEKEEILSIFRGRNKIRITGFKIFNTPWAKDKYGKRDTENLALFVEFTDREEDKHYWLVSEGEFLQLLRHFSAISLYNRMHDRQGVKWRELSQDISRRRVETPEMTGENLEVNV